MKSVGIHEAKTHLSRLLREVAAGEEIEIRRGSVPVARIVGAVPHKERQFGVDRGVFSVPDDFDAPLPDDLLDAFER
jgi:prevent-host-death family protein